MKQRHENKRGAGRKTRLAKTVAGGRRLRPYCVVLDAQAPEDLAARCSKTWRDLLDLAERLRKDQHVAEHDGDHEATGSHDANAIEMPELRPDRSPDGSRGR